MRLKELKLLGALWAIIPGTIFAAEAPGVPPEVARLAGEYAGSWTMFGITLTGEVARIMGWSDVIRAGNPTNDTHRAYVTTSDEMTFEGRPPMTLPGQEGYELNSDGSLGNYFIQTAGQTFKMVKLSDNAWAYATAATAQDLRRMGFPKGASGQHVVVKVVSQEQGAETHRISRLTTVKWTDSGGQEKMIQFISLQGTHKRK